MIQIINQPSLTLEKDETITLSFIYKGEEKKFSLPPHTKVNDLYFVGETGSNLSFEMSPHDLIFFCATEPASSGYTWNFDHFPCVGTSKTPTISQMKGVTILSDQFTNFSESIGGNLTREVLLSVDPILCSEIDFICRRPFNGQECNRISLSIREDYNSTFSRINCVGYTFKFENVLDYQSKIRTKPEFQELIERLQKYPCQKEVYLDLVGDPKISSFAQSTYLLALIESGHKDYMCLNVDDLPYWTKKVLTQNFQGYALWFISDQTHCYLTSKNIGTIVCKEAMIFNTYSDAKAYGLDHLEDQPLEIEAILDLEEFKSREDTW